MVIEQPILGSANENLNNAATEYNTLYGGINWASTEYDRRQIVTTAGKLKNFHVALDGTPGSGKTWTFTVMKNGAATGLACSISGTDLSASDTTSEVSVSAGDAVSIRATSSGSPTNRKARWSTLFEGNTNTESLILSCAWAYEQYSVRYNTIVSYSGPEQSEANTWVVIPTNGTIKQLRIEASGAPGTGDEAFRWTLRINGVDTALSVTLTGTETSGSDLSSEVSVVAGDLASFKLERLNSPSNTIYVARGMTFVADTPGESIILGGGYNPLDATTTFYAPLTDDLSVVGEVERTQPMQLTKATKLYVWIRTAPGGGAKRTFTLRKNNADTTITFDIEGSDTTGSDTVHTVDFELGDEASLKIVPTSSPEIVWAMGWGVAVTSSVAVGTPGYIWVEGTKLHYIDENGAERSYEGTDTTANGEAGHLWVEGTYLHYVDENGDERRQEGTQEGATGVTTGHLWIEDTKLRYIDSSGNERYIEGTIV